MAIDPRQSAVLVSSSVRDGQNAARDEWLRQVMAQLSDLPALVPQDALALLSSPARQSSYDGRLSIVRHAALWQALASEGLAEVHIVGSGDLNRDADAIAIAAYLRAARVVYHSLGNPTVDLSKIAAGLPIDFTQAQPSGRVLSDTEANQITSEINLHYVKMLAGNSCLPPVKQNLQTNVVTHFEHNVGVAQDLMMRVPEISGNSWWVIGLAPDGRLYETRDSRLAYAKFLEKLPNVDSALEVGCGSGFMTLFLAASRAGVFKHVAGGDVANHRVEGARLLAKLCGISADFQTMSADKLSHPDKSFDVVFTCFVLEQCAEILDRALDECFRVARKFVVLFEPSMESHPTLAGMVHIPANGFPTSYVDRLMKRGLAFSIVRPPLRHIYNPGVIHVISVDGSTPPHIACPDLLSEIPIVPIGA